MHLATSENRSISSDEAAIIRRALDVAPTEPLAPEMLTTIDELRVTATCKCGCATVWFGPKGDASRGRIVADALAGSFEEHINVIIWAYADSIVGLEFVGVDVISVPAVETVRPYEAASRT